MALPDKILPFLMRNNLRGKDRLYSLFTKLGFKKMLELKAKYGIHLNLNPCEYIDSIIIKEGFYESEITEVILNILKEGGTFWDIGANIGIQGLAVKKQLPKTNVYSFEPNPKTLGQLHDNASLNNLDLIICGFALFETAGVMTLHIATGNSGMSTLTPWVSSEYDATSQCLTVTGDELLSSVFKTPTVIKIDTEGSELQVLMGCKKILSSSELKAIIIETGEAFLTDENNEMALFLKGFGFKNFRSLERNENTHHALFNFVVSKF